MRVSKEALRAFTLGTKISEPQVLYIAPRTPTIIGYAVYENWRKDTTHAENVSAKQLEQPHVATTVLHVRSNAGSALFFLTIKQDPGPIWYRWIDPRGAEHHMLVCATPPDDDLAGALVHTKNYLHRRQNIWRICHRGRIDEEAADRMFNAVGRRLSLAYSSCGVLRHTTKERGLVGGGEWIEQLRKDNEAAARLFAELNIPVKPQAYRKVLTGALAALQ